MAVLSVLTTTAPPNQVFGVDTVNGGPIDCYTTPGGPGPAQVAFSVSIPEVSAAGEVVAVTAIVPELVGATYNAIDVLWPASTSLVQLALLDVSVSDAPFGEVTVRFLSTDFFPGATGQGLVLLVY